MSSQIKKHFVLRVVEGAGPYVYGGVFRFARRLLYGQSGTPTPTVYGGVFCYACRGAVSVFKTI